MPQDPQATCASSRATPSQEYQSRETGALCLAGSAHYWGWSGRPRHVGEPEALPDPALPCGLILLSSASYSTREGLRGRIRSEEGIEPALHSALPKTEKMSRVHIREWARGHGSHTDLIGSFLEGTDSLTQLSLPPQQGQNSLNMWSHHFN